MTMKMRTMPSKESLIRLWLSGDDPAPEGASYGGLRLTPAFQHIRPYGAPV